MFESASTTGIGIFFSPIAVILLFLVLVIIALAVFLIYSAIYRRRVNRALRQETPVGPTPEPRNAGKIILIALVAACVLWFLIWTVNQQKRLAKLEEDLSAQMSEISELLDQQAEALRRLNSPFSDIRIDCVAIHPETQTMELEFAVQTKTVAEDMQVIMMLSKRSDYSSPTLSGDNIVEMEGCEGYYYATVFYPMFADHSYDEDQKMIDNYYLTDTAVFKLTQGGVTQTETMSFKTTMWQDQMPVIKYATKYTYWYGRHSQKDNELTLYLERPVTLSELTLCSCSLNQVAVTLDLSEYLTEENGYTVVRLHEEDFDAIQTDRPGDWFPYIRYMDQFGYIHQRIFDPVDDAPYWDNDNDNYYACFPDEERIYSPDGELLGVYRSNWEITDP